MSRLTCSVLFQIRLHQHLSRQSDIPPFIVKMLNLQQDAERIYVVLEHCARGDFFTFVDKGGISDHATARLYAKQLLAGDTLVCDATRAQSLTTLCDVRQVCTGCTPRTCAIGIYHWRTVSWTRRGN